MLAGVRGHLVSESYLEGYLESHPPDATIMDAAYASLARWRHRSDVLGPASSMGAMVELGAEPVLEGLGYGPISQVEAWRDAVVGTAAAGSGTVAVVIAAWGARLDPLWRVAVARAGRAGAPWSLLFNGRDVRLIETGRVHTRR